MLAMTQVPDKDFTDCITDQGCIAAGLPAPYPLDDDGQAVGWDRCQPIGLAAWAAGTPGIACRSAAGYSLPGEELAWFQRDTRLKVQRQLRFDAWFWPGVINDEWRFGDECLEKSPIHQARSRWP